MQANRKALTRRTAVILAALAFIPSLARAQQTNCNFDISDNTGLNVWGNTIHLVGRPGAGTDVGTFIITNTSATCNYRNLIIASRLNLINVANQALAIPGANIIISLFPKVLLAGQYAEVNVSVEIPPATEAGVYRGRIIVRDDSIRATLGPSGEPTSLDYIDVEVQVVDQFSFGIVDPDRPAALDSVLVRGKAGQRASGVFRIANTSNAILNNARVTASDLRSESAVGLVIPAQNIDISTATFSSLAVGDTARVTVNVQIPRNFLGGRYRGTLFVQAEGTQGVQVPLIVVVTSNRGILFENNPVRTLNGDIARIAFNGDPGTTYKVAIFDVNGLIVYTTTGTVFAGVGGTPGSPGSGADFAVSVGWPLANGVGRPVASGMYIVVVESIVNGQRQLAQDKLMVIR